MLETGRVFMQYTFDNYKALVMLRRDGSFYTIIWQSAQMAIMSNWRASPATSAGAPYTISWWGARKWRGGMWWHVFVTPLSSHNSKGHWNCWTGFGCRCFPSWKHWDWWESWQLTWRSQFFKAKRAIWTFLTTRTSVDTIESFFFPSAERVC